MPLTGHALSCPSCDSSNTPFSIEVTSDRIHQPERRCTQGSLRRDVGAAREVEMRGAIARALSARVAAICDGLPVRVTAVRVTAVAAFELEQREATRLDFYAAKW